MIRPVKERSVDAIHNGECGPYKPRIEVGVVGVGLVLAIAVRVWRHPSCRRIILPRLVHRLVHALGQARRRRGPSHLLLNFYEGAALSVRLERAAIFSARRSSASRSSSGRRTMKEQSRPASTRAIQSKLQVEHRKSVPPSACSKASPIDGSCQRASSALVSSSTSTDHSSPGVLATALSTAFGESSPAGRANVLSSISASRTLSNRNSRMLPRKWQWPAAYQYPSRCITP